MSATRRHLFPVPTVDDREEWLEWRRRGLGASDVAGVLGLSPWSSPWSVWASKVGLVGESVFVQTEAMRFGLMAEDMLARYFSEDTGLHLRGAQARIENEHEPWMRATVDDFAYESASSADPVAVVEYKTTADPADAWARKIPDHYACQATWTTLVTGYPVVMFGVLHLAYGRPAFRVYTFQPDDCDLVSDRCAAFWRDHVLTGIAPDVDASEATTATLEAIHHADENLAAVEAPGNLADSLIRIAANQSEIRRLEKLIDLDRNAIREVMGDATVLTLGTTAKGARRIIATWKEETRAGYEVAPSTSRVLRVRTKGFGE